MTTEELAKLMPEEKRIAIAEACGWTKCRLAIRGAGGGTRKPTAHGFPPGRNYEASCPNYLGSLDAMHAAEKVIPKAGNFLLYESRLKDIVLRDWRGTGDGQSYANSFPIHATAAQRAEAFLLCQPSPNDTQP